VASAALGCASAPKPRPADPPPATAAPAAAPVETTPRAPEGAVTGLVFRVDPADAQISIDGTPRGTVADLADHRGLLPLAPGIYQVSLKAPGFVTWRAEVALRTGTETIGVSLARKP
jgi:hypothetical protein